MGNHESERRSLSMEKERWKWAAKCSSSRLRKTNFKPIRSWYCFFLVHITHRFSCVRGRSFTDDVHDDEEEEEAEKYLWNIYVKSNIIHRLLIVRSAFAIWNTERCAILSVVCFVYTVCHSVCIRIRIRGRGRKMVYCAKMRWLNRTLREPHHKLFARNCACGKLC